MRPFRQVDVFTDEFLLGNPVAVVHEAVGLDDETMAAFARWTNLSETTFLLPPADPRADYQLRIFTTERELPFAGHPTLGSARAWLAAGGQPRGADVVQECGAGLVRIRRDGARLSFAAPPLRRGGPVEAADLDRLAAGLRIARADIVDAQWCDNGPGWVAVLLRDAAQVLALTPDARAFGGLTDVGIVGPYADGNDPTVEVRALIVTEDGIVEDPVTGSLNAGLARWLIAAGHAPARYVAAQGTARRRRGRVHVEQVGEDIWIGGDTVIGVEGTVEL